MSVKMTVWMQLSDSVAQAAASRYCVFCGTSIGAGGEQAGILPTLVRDYFQDAHPAVNALLLTHP
eukprot:6160579-Amphidinium_carterae.1